MVPDIFARASGEFVGSFLRITSGGCVLFVRVIVSDETLRRNSVEHAFEQYEFFPFLLKFIFQPTMV